MAVLTQRIFVCAALLASGACGSTPVTSSDAALARNFSLEVQNPPGDSIGLDYSDSVTLRVRYLDDNQAPIRGEGISFTLLGDEQDSTGGASLSSEAALTDDLGIARVDLVVGAERVNFRVQASAANSPSVLFFIQVSDQGFSAVTIAPSHEGPRDESIYDRVELRIFGDSDVDCATFDIDNVPESMFPPRSLTSFAPTATFPNLPADTGYTVVGWTEIGTSRALAVGCLSLSSEKLRSGSSFSAALAITDKPFMMPSVMQLTTDIDVSALASTNTAQQQWQALSCPLGRAQLLLDCMADAQFPDGLLDCDGESQTALSAAMVERRGIVDGDGCRPPLDELGAESLDALLDTALSGWPDDAELQSLVSGRQSVLGELTVHSRLEPLSETIAVHRLLAADLGNYNVDLVATDRPTLEASSVPYSLEAEPTLSLAQHGFTLRFGEIAADAFEILGLVPANASQEGLVLGTKLIAGLSIGANSGCNALELFVCNELSLEPACADRCIEISASLDTSLASWLGDLQSTTGMDYAISINADTFDDDNDLILDSISASISGVVVEIEAQAVPATVIGVSGAAQSLGM